jgi:hypothetical protein
MVAITNHSRPGSTILILNALVLYEALRRVRTQMRPTKSDYTFLQLILLLQIFLAAVDILIGRPLGLWYGGDAIPGPLRLRLFFSEPSYLGLFSVGLIFAIPQRGIRGCLLLILLLTQSLYALAYALVLYLRRRPLLIAIGGVCGLAAVAFLIRDYLMFFSSSGLVRLAGIWLLPQMTAKQMLIGAGIGAGDLKLQTLYDLVGQSGAAGFFFSSVYDLGALGLFFIYLAYVRTRFDAAHLTFLLLNLGIGSFLIPVMMALYTRPAEPSVTIADSESDLGYGDAKSPTRAIPTAPV